MVTLCVIFALLYGVHGQGGDHWKYYNPSEDAANRVPQEDTPPNSDQTENPMEHVPHFELPPLPPFFGTPPINTITDWNTEFQQTPQVQYQPFFSQGSHPSGYMPQFSDSPPVQPLFDTQTVDPLWNMYSEDVQSAGRFPRSQYYAESSNAPEYNSQELSSIPFSNVHQPGAPGQYMETTREVDDSNIFSVVASSQRHSEHEDEQGSKYPAFESELSAVVTSSGRQQGSSYGSTYFGNTSRNYASSSNPPDESQSSERQSGYESGYGSNLVTDISDLSAIVASSGRQATQGPHYGSNYPRNTFSTVIGSSSSSPDKSQSSHFDQSVQLAGNFPSGSSVFYNPGAYHDFNRQRPSQLFEYDESNMNVQDTHQTGDTSRLFSPASGVYYPSPQPDPTSTYYVNSADDLYSGVEPFIQRTGKQTLDSGPSNTGDADVTDFSRYPAEYLEFGKHGFVSDFNEVEKLQVEDSTPPLGCELPIRKLERDHGLLMLNRKIAYPTSGDKIIIPHTKYIEVRCIDDALLNVHPDASGSRPASTQVYCLKNVLFDLRNNIPMNFVNFMCSEIAKPKLRLAKTPNECTGNLTHYQMGFAKGKGPLFVVIYNLCIDRNDNDRVVYTWNHLDRSIQGREPFQLPKNYMEPVYSSKNSPYDLEFANDLKYYPGTLTSVLTAQVGQRNYSRLTNAYAARIQKALLVSDLDFVYRSEQSAALHQLNVHPMWSNLLVHWRKLQIVMSNYAAGRKDYTPLTIHTGIFQQQEFPNEHDIEVPLYIYNARKSNSLAGAIPKYFYKRVYDPSTHKCVFLIGNNSATPFRKACPDVSGSVTWLKDSGINTDLIYACNCDHFKPTYLPDI